MSRNTNSRKATEARAPARKPYDRMSATELGEATREYNAEFIAMDRARPLSKAERAEVAAARRRGKPSGGKKVKKVIALSVERGLLDRADAFARRLRMTREALVVQALEREMAVDHV